MAYSVEKVSLGQSKLPIIGGCLSILGAILLVIPKYYLVTDNVQGWAPMIELFFPMILLILFGVFSILRKMEILAVPSILIAVCYLAEMTGASYGLQHFMSDFFWTFQGKYNLWHILFSLVSIVIFLVAIVKAPVGKSKTPYMVLLLICSLGALLPFNVMSLSYGENFRFIYYTGNIVYALYYLSMLFIVAGISRETIELGESPIETIFSELREENSVGLCVLFSILTAGIYWLYWKYRLCKKIRLLNGDVSSCTGEFICLLLVPFYSLYWYYSKGGQTLSYGANRRGIFISSSGGLYVVLSLFGLSLIADAIIQSKLNEVANQITYAARRQKEEARVAQRKADANKENKNIQMLQQLAELHDKGILSDEEFEAKKKDLLDRI